MEVYKVSYESGDGLYYDTYPKALKFILDLIENWGCTVGKIIIENDLWTTITVKNKYGVYQTFFNIEKTIIED